jgi:hypothetical protein
MEVATNAEVRTQKAEVNPEILGESGRYTDEPLRNAHKSGTVFILHSDFLPPTLL